jgi:nonribosomal peptide synthetase DhbF
MDDNEVAPTKELCLPLSGAQLGIWFAQKLDPLNPVYNVGGFIEIHGPIDTALFDNAYRQVVA